MDVLSLQFLALTALASIGYRSFPNPHARSALLALGNGVFVASFVTSDVAAASSLIGFLLSGWLCVAWVRARPSRAVLTSCIVWTVLLFVVLKQYSLVQPLVPIARPLMTVGLSYILFRVLHLIIDVGSGEKLEELTLLSFLNYTCMFLTFVSGPIQRFEDHARELRGQTGPLTGEILFDAGTRIVKGMLKLVFLAPAGLAVHGWAFAALHGKASPLLATPSAAQLSIATLAYLIFLYWNFSGYMDVALGAGRLMGFGLPENFTTPFSAPNFIELWSRWHITLSDWFRLYLFNPTVAALTRMRTDAALAPYFGVLGFLSTFFVMGVWHGTTGIFVFYGLLLGAGVSLNKLYQVQMRMWLGKQRMRRLADSRLYERACNGLCIAFFALALGCFWLDWSELVALARVAGPAGIFGALAASSCAVIVLRLVHDAVLWIAVQSGTSAALGSPWAKQALTAAGLLLLFVRAALGHSSAPPFVYAEF